MLKSVINFEKWEFIVKEIADQLKIIMADKANRDHTVLVPENSFFEAIMFLSVKDSKTDKEIKLFLSEGVEDVDDFIFELYQAIGKKEL